MKNESSKGWISAVVFAGYFFYGLTVQFFTGAWRAPFVAFPDEAAHFVGSVMVRDWLSSGRLFSPLEFAQSFYDHYPYFAVGYWPPAFHIVTGLVLSAGVGRVPALLVPLGFATGTAWLLFLLVRRHAGLGIAVCTGALFLCVPIVQATYCAVMADHTTVFFSILACLALFQYLERPGWRQAMAWILCCCAAILSKYSAVYLLALPIVTALLFRRDLFRKPSFLAQPVIALALVAPWVLWTRRYASIGLPAPEEVSWRRIEAFLYGTLNIFPFLLLTLLCAGLVLLALRPKAWRVDLGVLCLFCVGHLSLLIASPVGAERRYLFVAGAALMVLSAVGWAAAFKSLPNPKKWAPVLTGLAAVITATLVLRYSGHYRHPIPYPMSGVVAAVRSDMGPDQRILAPPGFEGPFIAEFVGQDNNRLRSYLLRPDKVLSRSDWFGHKYSSTFATPEEMQDYLRREGVKSIVWPERQDDRLLPHQQTLGVMLRENPLVWRKIRTFPSGGVTSSWSVYEYTPEAKAHP